jgi:hypothetical protein
MFAADNTPRTTCSHCAPVYLTALQTCSRPADRTSAGPNRYSLLRGKAKRKAKQSFLENYPPHFIVICFAVPVGIVISALVAAPRLTETAGRYAAIATQPAMDPDCLGRTAAQVHEAYKPSDLWDFCYYVSSSYPTMCLPPPASTPAPPRLT